MMQKRLRSAAPQLFIRVDNTHLRLKRSVDIQERKSFSAYPGRISLKIVIDNYLYLLGTESAKIPLNLIGILPDFTIEKTLYCGDTQRQSAIMLSIFLCVQRFCKIFDVLSAVVKMLRMQRVNHLHRITQHDDDASVGAKVFDLGSRAL